MDSPQVDLQALISATNFNTGNRTYRQLLGNGLIYRIPRFQRDYAWEEEQWEDLWNDMLGTLPADGEPAHYLGYLVLQTTDNRIFEVIDGQQRLTTISLIVLSAMRLLNKLSTEPDQQRLEQLRASYIGYLDPVTLIPRNKLELNRNNDGYYRDYLVTLAEHLPQHGIPASTRMMKRSLEWFGECLWGHVKEKPDKGVALARFIETISDRLFFTVITVADELNAYKVFETLNARGVRLSATDLLKNYLFSILGRSQEDSPELNALERRWEKMIERLGSENFPDFLRMHWNSRQRFARKSELFKTIRHHVKDHAQAFALLRDMDEGIDAYLALVQPDASPWPPAWKQSTRELRMFSVRQPYPMLMAARRRLDENDFASLLRATVIIAFRYNIIGTQRTGEQEQVYYTAAMRLERNHTDFKGLLPILQQIYRSDRAFQADFAEKSIKTTQHRNAKLMRYILHKLERHHNQAIDFDPDSGNYTLEHVLPQNPEAGWEAFEDRDSENFTHRIGNMLMLEAAHNKQLGNRAYAEKRPFLEKSKLSLTQRFARENQDWTPERLNQWQVHLARSATSIWRIAQLSS